MSSKPHHPILYCDVCGSGSIELRGALKSGTPILCGECGTERGRWPSFLHDLQVRVDAQRRLDRGAADVKAEA
ncbi:MAG TPA: hypothetical protein VIL09_17555 [Microvirga sp.]|jgi:hypothetical protein